MRTEDRQAREEAGYEHIAIRAMAPLEARIHDLEAAILAAKVLLEPTTEATEDVWQLLDVAYHRRNGK